MLARCQVTFTLTRSKVKNTALDAVRLKVEQGSVLSDAELRALQNAAVAEGTVSARLFVAHALLNAEALEPALQWLNALEKDFPREVQVPLARARALLSAERYADAEAPLRRALQLNPTDPEAKKGLAVLALRRGENARAQSLVNEVLEVDPFDSEAQALFTELEAQRATASVEAKPSLEQFARALSRELKAKGTPHTLKKGELFLLLPGSVVARVGLKQLYPAAMEGSGTLDEVVRAVAMELTERSLALPSEPGELLGKVLPVLREAGFVEQVPGMLHREGPAGLWVFYVVEDPSLVRYVPESALASLSLEVTAVDQAAWQRLTAAAKTPVAMELHEGELRFAEKPTGLWALATGDGHDAARLLTATQQKLLEAALGPGPWQVYLGLRQLVLLAATSGPGQQQLADLSLADEGISGRFQLHAGHLTALNEWKDV